MEQTRGFVTYIVTYCAWRSLWFQRLPSQCGHKYMNNISKTDLRVTSRVVSASDVTPTNRWLNVWCIWPHLSGNTSDWLNYTGFPGDLCVAFFNVPSGNKKYHGAKPPRERRKRRVYKCDTNAYQDQLHAGFSKVCEIFKIRSIEYLKYVREFLHIGLLLWWHFHVPNCDAERN